MRLMLVVALTAALLVSAFGTALAVVEKSGSTSCSPPASQVFVQSRAYGSVVRHYYPSGTFKQQWDNGWTDWVTRTSATGTTGTSWRVTSNGGLSNPNTYGYCGPW